jgi:hypothetical protein
MMDRNSDVLVTRAVDRSLRRKPLRLDIGRRIARNRAGVEKFVTQVRIGDAEAVLVPWRAEVPGQA